MRNFLQWLWAVIRFVPCAIIMVIAGILFYIFVPQPKEGSNARDEHHYLDHFDS